MSKNILQKLQNAAETQLPVRIKRGKLKAGTDVIDGLVTNIGSGWVLVTSMEDNTYFDGWELLRLKDITRVHRRGSSFEQYFLRAISVLGTGPEVPTSITTALSGPENEVVASVILSEKMCGISLEKTRPDELYVGIFEGQWGEKTFGLRQISPSGTWHEDLSPFKAKHITRVSIGGRYNNALEQFGDPWEKLPDDES